jgi:hypothetical protein
MDMRFDGEPPGIWFRGYLIESGRLLTGDTALRRFTAAAGDLKSFLAHANGAFAYVVYKGDTVRFGVDHFGGDSLLFSIEFGLRVFDELSGDSELRFSDEDWACLFACGMTFGERTAFAGVMACKPGILYEYDLRTRNLSRHVWFSPTFTYRNSTDADETASVFDAAVPRVDADTRLMLSLSGGLDSRLCLVALHARGERFSAFSYSPFRTDDADWAAELCRHLEIPHQRHAYDPSESDSPLSRRGLDRLCGSGFRGNNLPAEWDWVSANRLTENGPAIVISGIGGNWVTGAHLNRRLLGFKTPKDIAGHVLEQYMGLTAWSTRGQRDIVGELLLRSVGEPHSGEPYPWVAVLKRWEYEHYLSRYYDSAANYRACGHEVVFPFYDRPLMEYFTALSLEERAGEHAYLRYARKILSTPPYDALRDVPCTRAGVFDRVTGVIPPERAANRFYRMLTRWDPHRISRRITNRSGASYRVVSAFLGSTAERGILSEKVGAVFPNLEELSEAFDGAGCPIIARHLRWLPGQRVSQLKVNGMLLLHFLPSMLANLGVYRVNPAKRTP